MATPHKNYVELPISRKIEVLDLLRKGVSQRKIAKQFEISKTAVWNISKRKLEILEAYEGNCSNDRKRKRKAGPNDIINNKVLDFFVKCRTANIEVQGPMLQTQAKKLAEIYGIENFEASNGWLQSFLLRNNITLRVLCGESASVDLNAAEHWKQKLPEILNGYRSEDTFNADETGLFYRQSSKRSYVQKGESCKGGKLSKERISVLFCCSSTGEKLKPLVIGNAKYPRAFKASSIDVSDLPVTWKSNKKAWMTLAIFDEWLLSINRQMQREKRKILLLVDNATSHKSTLSLTNVTVMFLPPNLTSELQPLDQGIIRAVKARYRVKMLQYIVTEAESAITGVNLFQTVNVLHAVRWISKAWEEISKDNRQVFHTSGLP